MSANAKTEKITTLREETRETKDALYTYTLTVRTGDSVASFGLPLYSVWINMTDKDGNHTEASLEDIFSDSKSAFRFFDKLIRNLATPIDLPYVLEDEIHC